MARSKDGARVITAIALTLIAAGFATRKQLMMEYFGMKTSNVGKATLRTLRAVASNSIRPWLLLFVGAIFVFTAYTIKLGLPPAAATRPDTIEYHYAEWLHERANMGYLGAVTNGLTIKKAIWYLDGKPSIDDRFMHLQEHQDALIRLGYFKSRAFDWKGGDLNKFLRAFGRQARESGFGGFYIPEFINSQETTIYFTAREEDMLTIKSIIETIESTNTNKW